MPPAARPETPQPDRREPFTGSGAARPHASTTPEQDFGEEPPADYDEGSAPYDAAPHASPVRSEPSRSAAAPAAPAPADAPAVAQPATAPVEPSAASVEPVETPRQAAERRAARTRAEEAARAQVIDDPQPDDEDLMSSNLVGVPLVAQLLGGVVIDEIKDGEV